MNAQHLFVDSILGDDTTAQVNNSDRPWKTISNAVLALNSFPGTYLIYVRSGIYNEVPLTLLPSIVYAFYFEPRTYINCTNGLFNITSNTTISVYGYANFIGTPLYATGNTEIYFECESILTTSNYSIYYNSIGPAFIRVNRSITHIGDIVSNDPMSASNSCVALGVSNNLRLQVTSIVNQTGGPCIYANVTGYNSSIYKIIVGSMVTNGPITCNMLCYPLLNSTIDIICEYIASLGAIYFDNIFDIGTLLLRSSDFLTFNISASYILNTRLYSPSIKSGLLYCDNVKLYLTANRLNNINITTIIQPLIYIVNGCDITVNGNIITAQSILYRNNAAVETKVSINANVISLFDKGIICDSTITTTSDSILKEFISLYGNNQSIIDELQLFAPQLFVNVQNSPLTVNLTCNKLSISNGSNDSKLFVLNAITTSLHSYKFNVVINDMNAGLVYDTSVTSYRINGYIGNMYGQLLEQISQSNSTNTLSEVNLTIGTWTTPVSNIYNSTFPSGSWVINVSNLSINMPTNFNSSICIISNQLQINSGRCFLNLPYTGSTFTLFDMRVGSFTNININNLKATGNYRLFKCGNSTTSGTISLVCKILSSDMTTSANETVLLVENSTSNIVCDLDIDMRKCINRANYTDGSLTRLVTWLYPRLQGNNSRLSFDANILGISPGIGVNFGAIYFDTISPQGIIIFKDTIIILENVSGNTYSIYSTNPINARYYGYLISNVGVNGINNPTVTTNSSALVYNSPLVV